MKKYLLSSLVGLIILVIAACGGDDPTAVPVAAATAVPSQATTAPSSTTGAVATTAPSSGQTPASSSLQDVAAKLAGGPGAIYVGDLDQLVGPAPSESEGDADGNVPLASLQKHVYVYESDYYQGLIEKANLINPTELVSTGEKITIQHACVNRALVFCKIVDSFYGPNLLERTNGQLEIVSSSFPELGIAGPDTLSLVADGTLDMVSVLGVYVAGELPALEIQFLFGLYTSREDQYNATTALAPDLEKMVVEASGGAKLINFNWHSGDDIFLFTKKPLNSPEDIVGLKVRSFGTAIADWIVGMGANAQFMAFAEVYTALERGVIDAGVTGGDAGHGQRWYEVTDYINGPLTSWPSSLNMMNKDVWDGIPADLQAILIEEGARTELEALRVGAIQNDLGLQKNIDAGMEFVEFSPVLRELSDVAVVESIVPNWVNRVGGPGQPIVQVFNEKIGTIVGIKVEADGSITKTGVTAATTPTASAALIAYADAHAGAPGAIYLGDLSQLVGVALPPDLGDFDGNVPLEALELNRFLYDSDYYKGLLEKARLTNPTQLVSAGLDVTIQDACINRSLSFCKMADVYFHPNVLERTNGQIKLVITSYPELGISGTDNLGLISDGTLGMGIVAGAYVAGEVPALDITFLEGLYPDRKTMFNALAALTTDLAILHEEATDNKATLLYYNWSPGDDRYFFSKEPLRTLSDFDGIKVRAFGTTISDWIIGIGADAQFVAFAEVYTALERGILDAGVTGASPAFGQRWYEVTDYMNGPLPNFPYVPTMINNEIWDNLPEDIQQIMIEEGAKTELEMLRVSSIHNEIIVAKSIRQGLEVVEFSPEVRERSNASLIERMVPNWVKRVGGGDHPVVALFNEHVGSRVGMRIEPDGSVVKAPITKK
jgi:TRAP-type C4-dicarboxylate transport system substrate-binding protein